ncbi:uncharacterized protein LOC134283540 [Saccostrea cucullata]|uniref:uncharacterized protein LOC134283540 n=1 Tax=Saccostrea cuccullata TaxID=36930 RepID=UPI002ED1175F
MNTFFNHDFKCKDVHVQMHFKMFAGLTLIENFYIKSFIILIVTFLAIIEGCQNGSEKGTCTCTGYFFDERAKVCKECPPGYMGVNCLLRCRYPGCGQDCQYGCLCNAEHCDFRSGCVNTTDNGTHILVRDLSHGPGSRISISMFIKIPIIIIAGIIFLLLLILIRMVIIYRKTKDTLTKTKISDNLEGNDRNTMANEIFQCTPQSRSSQGSLHLASSENLTDNAISFHAKGRKKKRNKVIDTKNTGVMKTTQTDNVKTHTYSTFASIRNEMLGDSAYEYCRRN